MATKAAGAAGDATAGRERDAAKVMPPAPAGNGPALEIDAAEATRRLAAMAEQARPRFERDAVRAAVTVNDVLRAAGLPEASETKHVHCPFPAHPDANPSFRAPTPESWVCTCGAGDVFALYAGLHCLDCRRDFGQILEELARIGNVAPINGQTRGPALKGWRGTWSGCVPDSGRVAAYLRHRGLSGAVPDCLRYHAELPYFDGTTLCGYWPALVAAIVNMAGEQVAVHRIYLARQGDGNATGEVPGDPKKTQGPRTGAAIRLAEADTVVVLTEGIETGLAVMESTGLPVWPCVAADGVASVQLPEAIRTVYLATDADDKGRPTARKAAERFAAEGRDVRLALPWIDGADWLDILTDPSHGAQAIRAAFEHAEPIMHDAEHDRPRFPVTVDVADVLTAPHKPPTPVVFDLVDAGDKLGIVAPPKLRKTFFALQLAYAAATGADFLRWRCRPTPVLYVNAEVTAYHFGQRLKLVARGLGIDPAAVQGRFSALNSRGTVLALDDCQTTVDIVATVEDCEAGLVVLDCLYKFASGDENKAEDLKPALAAVDAICSQTGAAVCIVHHDGKGHAGERSYSDRGSGSNVLTRDLDAALFLTPHRDPEYTVVGCLARNYPSLPDFSVRWADGRFTVADDVPAEKLTKATAARRGQTDGPGEADVMQALQASGPVLSSAIPEVLRSKGLSQQRARSITAKLISDGQLREFPTGKNNARLVGTPADILRLDSGETIEDLKAERKSPTNQRTA